ncbi:unnamed protein product, partial [Prorocentrum cordatum]
ADGAGPVALPHVAAPRFSIARLSVEVLVAAALLPEMASDARFVSLAGASGARCQARDVLLRNEMVVALLIALVDLHQLAPGPVWMRSVEAFGPAAPVSVEAQVADAPLQDASFGVLITALAGARLPWMGPVALLNVAVIQFAMLRGIEELVRDVLLRDAMVGALLVSPLGSKQLAQGPVLMRGSEMLDPAALFSVEARVADAPRVAVLVEPLVYLIEVKTLMPNAVAQLTTLEFVVVRGAAMVPDAPFDDATLFALLVSPGEMKLLML